MYGVRVRRSVHAVTSERPKVSSLPDPNAEAYAVVGAICDICAQIATMCVQLNNCRGASKHFRQ